MSKDVCIIMPTIREFGALRAYYANARQHGFDLSRIHTLIMTEDFCDKQAMLDMFRKEGVSGEVFNEVDRRTWLKEHGLEHLGDVIPRKTHAEISMGLLYMWLHKNFKYGIFIDDDTLPFPKHNYFGTHVANLEYKGPIKVVSSDKNWVNTLHQNFSRHGLYPRGYPYSAMKENISIKDGVAANIVLSQGLWTNVPDLDAIRILMDGDLNGQAKTLTHETDFHGNFIPDVGNYITSCTMNLAFKREIIPVFYQLPMDDNPWKIGRFQDIWSGVFLKRACDVLGHQIVTGYPLCIHNKTPRNTFRDVNLETPALNLNEHLWRIVESAEIRGDNYKDLYPQLAKAIAEDKNDHHNNEFLKFMAEKMQKWTRCLEVLGTKKVPAPV